MKKRATILRITPEDLQNPFSVEGWEFEAILFEGTEKEWDDDPHETTKAVYLSKLEDGDSIIYYSDGRRRATKSVVGREEVEAATPVPLTWGQLKKFCEQVPDEHYHTPVILWREDEALQSLSAEKLEEDQYMDMKADKKVCFSLSEAGMTEEDGKEGVAKGRLAKVYSKDHPILRENF